MVQCLVLLKFEALYPYGCRWPFTGSWRPPCLALVVEEVSFGRSVAKLTRRTQFTMKLCRYCIENILQSEISWDYHRRSWESLQGEWDTDIPPHRHGQPEAAKKQEKDH